MLIETSKTIKETIEVSTPSYYKSKSNGKCIHITEAEDVIITNHGMIMIWGKESGRFRDDSIKEALSESYEPCTEVEFAQAFQAAFEAIASGYKHSLLQQL